MQVLSPLEPNTLAFGLPDALLIETLSKSYLAKECGMQNVKTMYLLQYIGSEESNKKLPQLKKNTGLIDKTLPPKDGSVEMLHVHCHTKYKALWQILYPMKALLCPMLWPNSTK